MHLDRDFDYLVPDEWHEMAVPGARVRVRFSGRLRDAYVIDRVHEPDVDSPKPLERVIDAVPPLSAETLTLIQDVADRYVGTFWDVARAAVPTRHARAESSVLRKVAESDAAPALRHHRRRTRRHTRRRTRRQTRRHTQRRTPLGATTDGLRRHRRHEWCGVRPRQAMWLRRSSPWHGGSDPKDAESSSLCRTRLTLLACDWNWPRSCRNWISRS